MKLLYTNASQFNGVQENGVISFGGFISSSQVPLDYQESLFSEMTGYTLAGEVLESKAIALYNDSPHKAENLKIDYQLEKILPAKFSIGFTIPNKTENGEYFVEKLPNARVRPRNINFVSLNSENNEINIGSLNAQAYLGIWILREIDIDSLNLLKEEKLEGYLSEKTSTLTISFYWNYADDTE